MSHDMFNLSALTERWQAELTVSEIRMGLCEEGRAMRRGRAQRRVRVVGIVRSPVG